MLHNRGESLDTDFEKLSSYKDPVFDAQKVYKVFDEILTNEVYTHNV